MPGLALQSVLGALSSEPSTGWGSSGRKLLLPLLLR